MTDIQLKRLVAIECGKDGDPEFQDLLNLWWELYQPSVVYGDTVAYWLLKRHSLIYMVGQSANKIDWKDADVDRSEGQQAKAWLTLIAQLSKLIQDEINKGAGPSPLMGIATRYTLQDVNLPCSFPFPWKDIVLQR